MFLCYNHLRGEPSSPFGILRLVLRNLFFSLYRLCVPLSSEEVLTVSLVKKWRFIGWGLLLTLLLGGGAACRCSTSPVDGSERTEVLEVNRSPATPTLTASAPRILLLPTWTPLPSPSVSGLSGGTTVPAFTPSPTSLPTATPMPTVNVNPPPGSTPAVPSLPTQPAPFIPSPTPTPSPRPTNTPTAIPPTPTPTIPAGWSVLHDNAWIDPQGWVHVLGEIYNNTGTNQENVLVVISFYNEQGLQVGGETTAPVVQVVPQGSKVPFEMVAELRLPYSRYQVSVEGETTGYLPRQDLEVVHHAGSFGTTCRISGELRNPDGPLSGYAEVIATLYDDAGRVAGVGYAFLSPGDLVETAPFEVLIEPPCDGVATYALLVLGF